MKLTDEIINDIRESASITEVIGHYIPLIKKGRGYTAVCPFHDDHDPSLSISEEKQIFKCFVCGTGGNVFTFVQKFKNCSFPEAVVEVSKIIGKPLDIEINHGPKKVSKYQNLYDILGESINFSNYILNTQAGDKANQYLLNRGLEKEVIDYFNIGYNPSGDVLYRYLKEKGFNDEDMVKANICRMSDYGMKDVFYDRVLFPIHDMNGNPVGFSGRSMDKDNPAKYVNTATTDIYIKGDIVYNYHRAIEDIKRAKRVIVCEGVMDVIAFKRAEIPNVVATLGTACTPKQLELIANACKHIVFCYDGDKAGQAATMKALELALNHGIEAYTIVNETGLDPDEILKNGKAKDLRNFASHEVTCIEFAFDYYRKLYPLNSYTNRKEYHLRLAHLISKCHDQYDRDNYYHNLQTLTNLVVNEPRVDNVVNHEEQTNYVPKERLLDGLVKAEYTILSQMMVSKKAVEIFRRDIGCLLDDSNDLIANMIMEDYVEYGDCNYTRIFDKTNDENIRSILLDLGTIETLAIPFNEDILKGAILKVKNEMKKAKLADLKNKIMQYQHVNSELANEYLIEYTKLAKELGGK